MAELGFLGAPIWERWGGAGMDYVSFGILCEELERADTAFRVVMSVHVGAQLADPHAMGAPSSRSSAGWCRRRAARSWPRSG